MRVFAITFGAKVFLGANPPASGKNPKGWRPYRWVRDQQLAELFSSEDKARTFGEQQLGHSQFKVTPVFPSRPFDGGGHPGRPILQTALA